MHAPYSHPDPESRKRYFDENGFVVAPGVVTGSRLEALRAKVDAVLDGTLKPDRVAGLDDFHIQWEPAVESAELPRHERIRVVFSMTHTHSWFWSLATAPDILDLVAGILGPDLRYYTDQMFVKPARHGSEVPWHHDSSYWPAVEPGLLSCWLAVDDVTVENGCVRYLPGTHRRAIPHRVVESENPNKITVEEGTIDPDQEVPVEMKAGDMCMHHSLTVHRSLPNASDRGRRGLVLIYLPADLRFLSRWDFPYGFPVVRGRDATP